MANIIVLGCGFGTALSVMWQKSENNPHKITAYTKFPEEIEAIKRDGEHKKLLPGVEIPPEIDFTTDVSKVGQADIVIFAVPSKFVASVASEVAPYVKKDAVIVNVGKGFEETSGKRLTEVIASYIPNNPVAVLTGPSHAEEIARQVPTTMVVASLNKERAAYVQRTLQTKKFRIYLSEDVAGCELGGALKNPIALCCGMIKGMGDLGDNTMAAVMTRGLTEIARLGEALGANWETFTGMSGVGDLIVTCISEHSRNNRAGFKIGQGMTAEQAVKEVGTVEGYDCVKIAVRIAKEKNVDLPIFEQIYKICYEGANPRDAVGALMNRPLKEEKEYYWEMNGR